VRGRRKGARVRLQSEVVELFMLRVYVTYTKKVRKFKNKKFIEKLSPIPALQLSYCINRTIAFFGNKYLESLFNNFDFAFYQTILFLFWASMLSPVSSSWSFSNSSSLMLCSYTSDLCPTSLR